LAIHTFVVVSHDPGDLCIGFDLGQDSLADL